MVAVGNLGELWTAVPEYVAAEELKDAFRSHFGAQWDDVLDVADTSFAYNAFNNAYFAVHNLRPVEDLTLERLLDNKGIDHPPNIIVS